MHILCEWGNAEKIDILLAIGSDSVEIVLISFGRIKNHFPNIEEVLEKTSLILFSSSGKKYNLI